MDYRPVVVQRQPRPATRRSQESRHWRSFKHPVFIKEHAPVTSVHFAPTKPHRYAVTAATHVQIYAPRTQKVVKTISRFKDVARSGHIRADGKLLVAGDDSGLIQLFDMSSRAILRSIDDHKLPVHVTKFSPDNVHILSCSDDTTVRLWDVPSQAPAFIFRGHTDYVRSGLVSPSNPSLVLSGGYDGTVRLFDCRTGTAEMIMAGQMPVEDVLLFPSGGVVLSVSGPILKAWDLVAGGRCIRALSNHQKTATCLCFNGDASRVLTGGLDQMIKVYDVGSYNVLHTMRYPAPILSIAISPDDTHIAAGMSDGSFCIRRRERKSLEATEDQHRQDTLRSGAYEFFMGNGFDKIGERRLEDSKIAAASGHSGPQAITVKSERKKKLKSYDAMLKTFRYGAALDSVLQGGSPTEAFSVIQELRQRDGLRIALSGRDDVFLEPVLRLLLKTLGDPRFSDGACDMAAIVLDIYRPVIGQSPLIDRLLRTLHRKVDAELKLQRSLQQVHGSLDMLIASAALRSS